MRYAVIDNGDVVNVIEAGEGFALDGYTLVPSDIAGPGWTYDGAFHPPVSPPPTQSDYTSAIMALLDGTARQRQYDNALSISTYVDSTIPSWAAEAAAFVAWRDAVWAYALTELGKVENGLRPQPTVAELIAELPAISWPQ